MAQCCAIPRDYLSDTPLLRAMGFLASRHGQSVAMPPAPFSERFRLGEHAKWRCDTPPSKGVSQRYWRDSLWKQGKWVRYPPLRYYLERVLRDRGGITHWAAKSSRKVWAAHVMILLLLRWLLPDATGHPSGMSSGSWRWAWRSELAWLGLSERRKGMYLHTRRDEMHNTTCHWDF